MSRTRHHRYQRRQNNGRDLWKPGPTSGWSRCSEAKKLGRRIQRKRDKRALQREEALTQGFSSTIEIYT